VNNFVGDATVTDNGGPGVEFADSSDNVLADSRVERNGGPGVLSYPAGGDRLENVRSATTATAPTVTRRRSEPVRWPTPSRSEAAPRSSSTRA